MTRVGLAKGILTLGGILLFLWANREDQQTIRWIAIAVVFCAFLLRFVERGDRRPRQGGEDA
jgi:hypothetical protein